MPEEVIAHCTAAANAHAAKYHLASRAVIIRKPAPLTAVDHMQSDREIAGARPHRQNSAADL